MKPAANSRQYPTMTMLNGKRAKTKTPHVSAQAETFGQFGQAFNVVPPPCTNKYLSQKEYEVVGKSRHPKPNHPKNVGFNK